jgi:hypothetical protein
MVEQLPALLNHCTSRSTWLQLGSLAVLNIVNPLLKEHHPSKAPPGIIPGVVHIIHVLGVGSWYAGFFVPFEPAYRVMSDRNALTKAVRMEVRASLCQLGH